MMQANSSVLVILVHGTWGRGFFPEFSTFMRRHRRRVEPRWFEEGSQFRSNLFTEMTISGFNPQIISFDWCGSNSVFARARAALSLQQLISRNAVGRPIIIIAHSHAGNVALRATDGANSHIETTVVTLATPFLRIFPTMNGQTFRAFFLPTYLVCIAFLFFIGVWLSQFMPLPEGAPHIIALLLGIPLSWWMIDRLINPAPKNQDQPVKRSWSKRPFELASAANYSIASSVKLLVLREANDEASLALAAGRIGSTVSNSIRVGLANLATILFLSPLGTTALSASARAGYGWTAFIFVFLATGLCFFFMCTPGLCNSAFGREFIFGAARAEVAADSVPDASHAMVRTLSPEFERSGFRHGLYNNQQCIGAIVNFLIEAPLNANLRLYHNSKETKSSLTKNVFQLVAVILLGVVVIYSVNYKPLDFTVLDSNKVRLRSQVFQLTGIDIPNAREAQCEGELAQARRAQFRLEQLISRDSVRIDEIECPCRRRSKGCRYYQSKCGRISVDGEDVSAVLIKEGYARPLVCEADTCAPKPPRC